MPDFIGHPSQNRDDKYVTIKRTDWEEAVKKINRPDISIPIVHDAVVIRLQDCFAPPALDAYANSIQVAVELLERLDDVDRLKLNQLRKIADYFHRQATVSWDTDRKIPD